MGPTGYQQGGVVVRVYIGPYKNWFGPYQLAEVLCFWAKPVEDEYGIKSKPHWVHQFGEWLAHGRVEPDPTPGNAERLWGDDRPITWLYALLLWIDSKRQRKIQVRIHSYDTWSMDHTLAHIVLPMLKQLQEYKHGAPLVSDEDVPQELRSTSAPPRSDEYAVDDNRFRRWDWVMGEMIFAFENELDDSWEDRFRTGEYDFRSKVAEWGENGKPKLYQLVNGPNHTVQTDWEGIKAYQARIDNGFRLFGKYYQHLWD